MLESPQTLDLYCENCPKGYNTKQPGHLKAHKKTCPAHQIRGPTPDLYCENCPKGYGSKHPANLKTHKQTCPTHKGQTPSLTPPFYFYFSSVQGSWEGSSCFAAVRYSRDRNLYLGDIQLTDC
jgi:hypothetical protein